MSSSICGTRIRRPLLLGSALVALTGWFCSTTPLEAQSGAPGWTLRVRATNVSTLSGGEALAADSTTGNVFVKSLQDPAGSPVQLARIGLNGSVTILATFSLKNSDTSGIVINPLTGGIIVADETGQRIALIDPSTLTVTTLFSIPWMMNPSSNGTGQQRYAPILTQFGMGPTHLFLYFWDSTRSGLFGVDALAPTTVVAFLLLDQGTAAGLHFTTAGNHIVFDSATGTLLLTDGSTNTVVEVNPATSPVTVTTLFSGLPGTPTSIALKADTNQVFLQIGNSIYVGPRSGGPLSLAASGFTGLTDIVIGKATSGVGSSVFAVSKNLNTLYEIAETRVYVSTFAGNQILAVGSTSGLVTVLNADATKFPEDIVVGPDTKIYICDADNNDIRRMNQDGSNVETVYNFSTTTGTQCNGGPCPTGPEGPSVDTLGDLYFNTRGPTGATGVWKITSAQLSGSLPVTPTNVVTAAQTGSTFGEGTTFDANGKLLFVDRSGGKVWRLDTSTSPLTLTNIISGLTMPFGIAVNPAGDIFVSDGGANSVKHYDTNGASLGVFVSFTSPDNPAYLQFDASGNLFVVTSQTSTASGGKVWRVSPSGTKQLAGQGTNNTLNFAVGLALPPTSASFTQALNPNGGVYVANFGQYNYKAIYPPNSNYSGVFLTTTAILTAQSTYQQRVANTTFASTKCVPYATADGYCVTLELTCQKPAGNPIDCPAYPSGTFYNVLTSYNTQLPQPSPGFLRFFPIGSNQAQNILVAFYQLRLDQTDSGTTPGFSDFIAVNGVPSSQALTTNICLLYDPTRSVQSGAVYPIKLFLGDATCSTDFSSSSIVLHATGVVPLSPNPPGPLIAAGNANPDFDFRFDSTLGPSGGYIFNLKTTNLGTGTWGLNFTVTTTVGTVIPDIVLFGVQ